MTLKMRGFDKLEKKKFCVKAYWRKTVIPALVQICVTVFISKQNIASRLWDWVEICRCCKFDKISEVFESIMPDSKCGPFNKEEQLFIIEEFARSPTKSVSDVKRAFRQKFENSKPWSRRSCSALHHSAFSRVYDKFKKNGIKDTFNPGQVRLIYTVWIIVSKI